MAANWASEEFETIDLGDKRLDERSSIPGACADQAETVAAYRLLAHEDVSWRDVLQAHGQATVLRMSAEAVVLCLQDTTELDYHGRAMRGLGPLSYEAQRGLYVHPTYAVTVQREPLGILNAWKYAPGVPACPTVGAARWRSPACSRERWARRRAASR